jgi:pyrrolidone-carboxylate peptidase
MKFHFIPHVRCRKFPTSRPEFVQRVKVGRNGNLNARFVQLTFLGKGIPRNEVSLYRERIAINCNDGEKDKQRYRLQTEKIFEHGADDYFSTLPIQQMIESLPKAKLPARFSNTAEHIFVIM